MGDMRDTFELYREMHQQRVKKNPDRIAYAIRQLETHGIEYTLKNSITGHFHCRRKSDNVLIQFWTGTGKIMGYDHLRGIHNLVKLCERSTNNET